MEGAVPRGADEDGEEDMAVIPGRSEMGVLDAAVGVVIVVVRAVAVVTGSEGAADEVGMLPKVVLPGPSWKSREEVLQQEVLWLMPFSQQ